jgi:predicted nucleotidyltransferase
MNNNVLILLDIVRCYLSNTKYNQMIEDEKEIFRLAIQNGLSGIVFSVIDKEFITLDFYERLKKVFYEYLSVDTKQVEAIHQINKILNENKIDHIFLKGSMLKNLYQQSHHRAMGDIDILIKPNQKKLLDEVFQKNDIQLTQKSVQHDSYLIYNKIVIEIHPTVYKEFNDDYEKLINYAWDHAKLDQDNRYKLKNEFEIIYLLYHLAKHMDSSGIGIRSVLDIGIYLKHYENQIDYQLLETYLDLINMKKFYLNMIELNKKLFLFEFKDKLNNSYVIEDKLYEELIDYLVKSGIHGNNESFNAFEYRLAKEELKKSSKSKFILRIMFPKYEDMLPMYPFIEKAKTLILLAWAFRLIKLTFKKTKSSFKKLRKLKVKKEDIDSNKEFFKKLGL